MTEFGAPWAFVLLLPVLALPAQGEHWLLRAASAAEGRAWVREIPAAT